MEKYVQSVYIRPDYPPLGCLQTEDRRPKTEDRRPKTEDRRPKNEDFIKKNSETSKRRP